MIRSSHQLGSLALLVTVAVGWPATSRAQDQPGEGSAPEAVDVEVDEEVDAPRPKPERIAPQRLPIEEVPVAVPAPAATLAPARPAAPAAATNARPDRHEAPAYVMRQPNWELIVGGGFVLATAYGFSAMTASASPVYVDRRLYIPVVGPWIDLAERPSCGQGRTRPSCETQNADRALLIASGTAQSLGALLIVGGVLFPKLTIVSSRTATAQVLPQAGSDVAGVIARGSFTH